jgi:hypothetical protein
MENIMGKFVFYSPWMWCFINGKDDWFVKKLFHGLGNMINPNNQMLGPMFVFCIFATWQFFSKNEKK